MARHARFDRESAEEVIPECCDGLLWIGQSYAWVDCRQEESCAIPHRKVHEKHCFVHEAEWRGVSRKIAAVPPWAVPGWTRIFLAHRGDQRQAGLGQVFGYFVLGRVERLTAAGPVELPQDDVAARGLSAPGLGALDCLVVSGATGRPVPHAQVTARPKDFAAEVPPLAVAKGGRLRGELEPGLYDLAVVADGFEPAAVAGVSIRKGRATRQDVIVRPTAPTPEEPREKTRTRRCPDGTVITTHVWRDGAWVRTDERCDEVEEPECVEGQLRLGFCPDGVIVSEVCVDGEWRPTRAQCPQDSPVDDEVLAEERSCSLRLQPGAVYLVDSLAAEVHDRFRVAVASSDLRERYQGSASAAARESVAEEGRELFALVADEVRERRDREGVTPYVPACLSGKARVRGDLVLFTNQPIIARRPRASFRSLARIDGDDFLLQVASGKPEASLRLYAPPGKGAGMTWAETTATLGERCGTSRAIAHAVLTALAALAREALEHDGKASFRLQNLGTFRWRRAHGQPDHLVFDLAKSMRTLPPP